MSKSDTGYGHPQESSSNRPEAVPQAAEPGEESTLLNLTHETIIVRRPDSTIVFWNRGAEEMYGWASGEVLGKITHELLQTVFPVSRIATDEELMRSGRWEGELVHTRRDGSQITVSSRQVLQRDGVGNPIAVLEINTDITQRKRDEERIRSLNARLADLVAERTASELEMRLRLAAIVDSSEEAIISMSFDGLIESWNPAAARLFGYSEDEVMGRPVSIIYPPDRQAEFPLIMGRVQRGEGIEHFETVRVRKDGTRFDASISISPTRDANGNISGAAKIIRNISEEKRTREAERFLAGASGALAGSLDYAATLETVAKLAIPFLADFCLVQVEEKGSPLARAAVAAADGDNEKRLREIIQNHPPSPPAGIIGHALETAQPEVAWRVTGDFLTALKDTPVLVQAIKALKARSYMAIPMIARGRTIGLVHYGMAESGRYYDPLDLVIAQDLAWRAALAIDNSGLYQQAQTAVVARDQFLAVASHEVRTPLTIVQGYAQLIRRQAERASREGQDRIDLDRTRLIRSVDNIEGATERLRSLIADLLEVSTMRDRTMTLSRERVDLVQLVQQSVEVVRRDKVYHEHLQELEIVSDLPDQPVWGEWDGGRLRQVLINLIANAVKYSFSGGVIEVGLRVEVDSNSAELAHVRVGDQGIGIPSSEIHGLFEPFRRTSTATARHYPGLGLGLAVSREVISRHGGRIWAESDGVDRGSTFHVVLPIFGSNA